MVRANIKRLFVFFGAVAAAALAWPGVLAAGGLDRRVVSERRVTDAEAEVPFGMIAVSQDGRRFAYVHKTKGGWAVEVDGQVEAIHKAVGPLYPPVFKSAVGAIVGIKPMIFSADSRHLAYTVREGDGWAVVHDGRPGASYEAVGGPVLSPDGQHLAYAAQAPKKMFHGRRWLVVADGVEGPKWEMVSPPVYSPDGEHLAYAAHEDGKDRMVVDGVVGKAYDSLNSVSGFFGEVSVSVIYPQTLLAFPVFSREGRIAYRAKQAGRWYIVVEGQESEPFDSVLDPGFSPDGKRLAFQARKDRDGTWSWVVDGQPHGSFQKESGVGLAFSPDSRRLVYAGKAGDTWAIYLDDRCIGTHDDVGQARFSPDGGRLAYPALSGKRWAMSVDGVLQKGYKSVWPAAFSPDGSHLAYVAARDDDVVVVVDGVEGKPLRTVMLLVFDDNTHFHYIGAKGHDIVIIDEELASVTAPHP